MPAMNEGLLTPEEIIAAINKDNSLAEGGTLVSLSERGKAEHLSVCKAQIAKSQAYYEAKVVEAVKAREKRIQEYLLDHRYSRYCGACGDIQRILQLL